MTTSIQLGCPKCGKKVNPNDDSTQWGPPNNPQDVGSIRCPECGTRSDYVDWKTIT